MKKLTAIIGAISISAALLVGCGGGKYTDGTYSGEGQGASSAIKVEVVVEKGKISEVKLVEHNETKTLVEGVENNLVPEIIEKQGTDGVAAISGATSSSQGVIDAVNNALKSAKK